MKNISFFITLLVLIVITNISYAQNVSMSVKQGPNVDVMVTVGQASQNLELFENDLGIALAAKGIPADKLRVEAYQRSTFSSSDADAEKIFTQWTNYPDNSGAWSFNSTDNSLGSTANVAWTGFWDASEEAQATTDVEISYKLTEELRVRQIAPKYNFTSSEYLCHPDPMGFTFRMTNKDGLYSYYAFWIYGYQQVAGLFKVDGVTNPNSVDNNLLAAWTGLKNPSIGALTNNSYCLGFKSILYNPIAVHDVTIKAENDHIQVIYDGETIFDITDDQFGSPLLSGSYGPFTYSMPNAKIYDISVTKKTLRKFKDVLREPQWRNSALRFNVNLDDLTVDDFDADADLSEILMRCINEDIHYIGWGVDANKTQFERFIAQNSAKGTFINRSNGSWSTWIEAMAQYIYDQYVTETVEGEYFIAGTSVEIDVDPSEMKSGTANSDYPSGRWKISHDNTFFSNDLGLASWQNIYLEDVPEYYDKPGKYTFTFEDLPTDPTTLYFHRKPIASFSYVSSTGGLTNNSYDVDGGSDNGIAVSEWKWKAVDAVSTDDWTVG
ncbi:hypothetical protein ACE01N_15260, partial [Saccharicrinis sp. FJH2]|uniref:hypothetical protein n=1 Tax=Saccharicrinis sp. FJH65 TaxID=3344659 RepID=UPI0035F4A245